MRRAERQAAARVNVPAAQFTVNSAFPAAHRRPYEAMHDLCDGIALSQSAAVLRGCLADLDALRASHPGLAGVEWAVRVVIIALAARFDDAAARAELAALRNDRAGFAEPVLIVAGTASATDQHRVDEFRPFVDAGVRTRGGP